MYCPNCNSPYHEEDIYCSHCGADLTVPTTSIVPVPKNIPAILYNPQLSRSVAASVGALALGVGLELLRRSLLARLAQPSRSVTSALPILGGLKDVLVPQNNKPVNIPKGYEVQETFVYIQRVIRRQDITR
jgi:hypothetical protein